jgi:hypothetical protein
MQLKTAVTTFQKEINLYVHKLFSKQGGGGGFSTMVLKCNMLTLLIARPCSNAFIMWRGLPSPGCLYVLRIPTNTERVIRGHGPQ